MKINYNPNHNAINHKGSLKNKVIAGAIGVSTLLPIDLALRSGEVREGLSRIVPLYHEVHIGHSNSNIDIKNTFFYSGSMKGKFDSLDVDLTIKEKVLKILDNRTLSGSYKVKSKTKPVDLTFDQKLDWTHDYGVTGTFGNKKSNIKFINPLIKHGKINGSYNSKPVNLDFNKQLSNMFRNDYKITGELNGKPVNLRYKTFLLHGSNIEGTFNGKPVALRYDKKFNLIRDERHMDAEFKLNTDDQEDLFYLQSVIQIKDMQMEKLKKASESSSKSSKSSSK